MNSKSTNADRLQADHHDWAHAINCVPPTMGFHVSINSQSRVIRPGRTAESVSSATAIFQSRTQTVDLFTLTRDCHPEATCTFDSLELIDTASATHNITTALNTATGQYS